MSSPRRVLFTLGSLRSTSRRTTRTIRATIRAMGLAGLALAASTGCWGQQSTWARDTETDALTRKKGESEAEALYRAGHTCMEVHERDACAIEYFERLVEKDPRDRALVGDAMFRLVELYKRAGREDDARLLMRQFWDRGMDQPNRGALPYAARWLPADMELITVVDAARFRDSQLRRELEPDTVLEIFSCDPATVERLKAKREAHRQKKEAERRARRVAAGEPAEAPPKTPSAREQERRDRYARRADPVAEVAGCPTAVALDATDRLEWIRMLTAQNTDDPARSAALYGVPDLDARLAAAVQAGRLEALEDGSYQLPGLIHGLPKKAKPDADEAAVAKPEPAPADAEVGSNKAQRVRLLKVDLDQVLLAGDEVMDEMRASIESRDETLAASLVSLAQRIPNDVTFFTVLSPEAMQRSFEDIGALAALLPKPEGMLFAAVAYDYAGMFVRIPTSNPLKAAALLSIIKTLIRAGEDERAADQDPSAAERAIEQMDLSQTSDGKALQMTTVLSPEDIDAIFLDG